MLVAMGFVAFGAGLALTVWLGVWDSGTSGPFGSEKDRAMEPAGYDHSWLADLPLEADTRQSGCLSEALYFEARGEPLIGQLAVGSVILNRSADDQFPDGICAVIRQGEKRGRCQFSYRCSRTSFDFGNPDAYKRSRKLAQFLLAQPDLDFSNGAIFFHTSNVDPYWAHEMVVTAVHGKHVFLMEPTEEEGR